MNKKVKLYISINATINDTNLLKYLKAGCYCEAEKLILDEYLVMKRVQPEIVIDAWEEV